LRDTKYPCSRYNRSSSIQMKNVWRSLARKSRPSWTELKLPSPKGKLRILLKKPRSLVSDKDSNKVCPENSRSDPPLMLSNLNRRVDPPDSSLVGRAERSAQQGQ